MNAIDFFTAMNESLVNDIVGEIKSELVSIQEMTKENQEILERRFILHQGLFMGLSHRMSDVVRIQLEKALRTLKLNQMKLCRELKQQCFVSVTVFINRLKLPAKKIGQKKGQNNRYQNACAIFDTLILLCTFVHANCNK